MGKVKRKVVQRSKAKRSLTQTVATVPIQIDSAGTIILNIPATRTADLFGSLKAYAGKPLSAREIDEVVGQAVSASRTSTRKKASAKAPKA